MKIKINDLNLSQKNSKEIISTLNAYQQQVIKETKKDNPIIRKVDFSKFLNLDDLGNGKLKGDIFAIKDVFARRGEFVTGGARILENYRTPFSSSTFEKLIEEGAIPLFSSNLDALGMGGTGLTSSFGKVKNPLLPNNIIGGSSSGSAYLVANGDVSFAIASDTGDSVRRPAAYSGIVGFKPTWGLVSRYGEFDFAPSFDTTGWFTNTVTKSAEIADVLIKFDPNDSSSIKSKQSDYLKNLETKNNFTIGVISPILEEVKDKEISINFNAILKKAEEKGIKIKKIDVDLNILRTILIVYRIITSIESFSCYASLTGFLFGEGFENKNGFEKDLIKTRTENLPYEVRRRWMFAMQILESKEDFYPKARKMRNLINKELSKIFSKVDALVMPAHSKLPPSLEEGGELNYSSLLDNYLTLFNANGSPSITIPMNNDRSKPTALNVTTSPFKDLECLQVAKILEDLNE